MSGKPKNFSQAIDDLEGEPQAARPDFTQKIKEELHKIEEQLHKLKPHLDGTKDKVEDQVQKNPWAVIGVVGLLFFVVGFLLGFRRRE